MFARLSATLPRRSVCAGGRGPPGAPRVSPSSGRGALRTRYFSTNSVIYSKKDDASVPTQDVSKEPVNIQEKKKKDLLNIIMDMKVELSVANVQTTRPPGRKPLKSSEASTGRHQKGRRAASQESESLSPELVAAASAVADSLPFNRQTTKSELLRQLQLHEEDLKAQRNKERPKISFSNLISDMKIAKSPTARSRRPVHQIQFDEGADDFLDQEKTSALRTCLNQSIFKGKRLNIFEKSDAEEAPETETTPSLWDLEFAKQLATVNEQPLQNGFEEMIQWTKEGKLWTFPINNEIGLDDDGSEFHEHIFLDKYLEDFPKQGPIRHFMELVTNGLSKNPYLSVKQKVEHIEWFRNYFNEKQDILKIK
ncbi:small ribosomal subunit protein mS31 isoform X1 [Erinaceus europaeus]|uniref:Small ribosomal subunit protein mS31 n=1 Tax=Erinaceus europaeus TaxID=9365 RepID=A0ABM3XPY7_ERIEU|nr:small ribosomal subunit protein mS31 isoform X1 [Erinaceus europaeus]